MKTALILATALLLTGCSARPLVGSFVLCIAADCDIKIKPDNTQSGAEKAGAGIAQFIAEQWKARQKGPNP